jgi:putative SOS response-associated peptidase YedK
MSVTLWMPVILLLEHYHGRLQPKRFEPEILKSLLRPYPAGDMDCCRVSKLVNNAKKRFGGMFETVVNSVWSE